MFCVRFGHGSKQLVIIAGMSLAGLVGLGGAVAQVYRRFTDEYTVTVFDRVERLPDGCTVRDMARQTAEAMTALGIDRADVMGASQGGMIGLYLAIDRPELVRSLLLASSCAYLDEACQQTMTVWSRLADANDGVGIYRDFFPRVYTHPNMELLPAIENSADEEQCRRFGILARACLRFDCRDELGKVRCPVLVITADEDHALSCQAAVETARLLGCGCYVYHGWGHAIYDEAPDFAQRMADFLRG